MKTIRFACLILCLLQLNPLLPAQIINDPYYYAQWNLEHRNEDGSIAGVDLNVRPAWAASSQGQGVCIAIVDTGIDMKHPDLKERLSGQPHYNFVTDKSDGSMVTKSAWGVRGTASAGLAAATANNGIGMAGIAPKASLASWAVYATNGLMANSTALAKMYQYENDRVWIQNHGWPDNLYQQQMISSIEWRAISNAVYFGRQNKGVVMVRAGGNGRVQNAFGMANHGNANDNPYLANPRVIPVAAVRFDGRVSSYSHPGSCILVAAPSDDVNEGFNGVFTTDIQGILGLNTLTFPSDPTLNDYLFDGLGYRDTSAATAEISGVVALILGANPDLSVRDVQQILILSARHTYPADPDLHANGAGFVVSHNDGFGVPDAEYAVYLAQNWQPKPEAVTLSQLSTNNLAIPDDGLQLLAFGDSLPSELTSISARASEGPHPDAPTAECPLVHLGDLTNAVTMDMHGKAALIQRGANRYSDKINWAAQAGAEFVVIYNNKGGTTLDNMGGTGFVPIPAVFISQNSGTALASFLTNSPVTARLQLNSVSNNFVITTPLVCEHVAVEITANHPHRGEIRLTLTSPSGTRSILQHMSFDISPGPNQWTYYSCHHFFESSMGIWTVSASDEMPGSTGSITSLRLIIHGIPIADSDHDGLDDNWEMQHYGNLNHGPADQPLGGGFSNARLQAMGKTPSFPIAMKISRWNDHLLRINWPGSAQNHYRVNSSSELSLEMTPFMQLDGHFPWTELFIPTPQGTNAFFGVSSTLKSPQ